MKRIAITPLAGPIKAKVVIPGSKSYTNRALLLAALTPGTVRVKNPLVSDDTHAMIACLRQLGIACSFKGDALEVKGSIADVKKRAYTLNANLSGTTIRFILALACIVPGEKTVRGRGRLNERPVVHLVEALAQLGAAIEYVDKKGYPPLRVHSARLTPGTVRMKGTISSQFLSALLMISPTVGDMTIEVDGTQVSKPYIDMTIEAMGKFGVKAINQHYRRYLVPGGQQYSATSYTVEGDVSSASYFFAIAALTRSTIKVANVNPDSLQADMRFLEILEKMGTQVKRASDSITVTGVGVRAIQVNMEDCPDQAQTLAVLAAFAPGKTTITGIRSLRVKETERVIALEQELKKMGVRTQSTADSLVIHGGSPKAARVETYGDHRMAMSFAVAAAKLGGLEIEDPDVVSKTFPRFWDLYASLGMQLRYTYQDPNIVLIGMRGGGKSTVAKLLAKHLGRDFADLDALVEKREGLTIPDIVEKYGWDYFRDCESAVVRSIARRKNLVISTGGGVINRPENIAALKRRGIVVFLSAPADVLAGRIEKETGRPQLTEAASTLGEVEAVLAERKKLYEAVADETIDAAELTPEQEVAQILLKLQDRGIIKK